MSFMTAFCEQLLKKKVNCFNFACQFWVTVNLTEAWGI